MLDCRVFAPRRYFGSNSYLLHSDGEYAVIDPAVPYERVLSEVPDIAGKVKYIILTHCHFDHILRLAEWIENTGVFPTLSPCCKENLKDPDATCYRSFLKRETAYFGSTNVVSDGDSVTLGGETLSFILTPGHTDCSLSVIAGDNIFVGDLIFEGGARGRCDLPTANESDLHRSINRVLSLDENLNIMSGHGEKTTVFSARKYRYL